MSYKMLQLFDTALCFIKNKTDTNTNYITVIACYRTKENFTRKK